jgi:hypothetical protein
LPIDRKYLQEHFASLSDESLADVNRSELVEAAQQVYDEERARRGSAAKQKVAPISTPVVIATPVDEPEALPDDEFEAAVEEDDRDAPGWVDDAACACSFVDYPGTHLSPEATNARDVLRAAGIACYVAVQEIPAEGPSQRAQVEYRVLVPGALNLKALSVLDKEVFNERLEADWKTHFEQVSDGELLELSPDVICAGLADRIERLTRAFEEEVARRGLAR